MGKVYLIGAGPGDEELITIKAVNALSKCTAVLYDRLSNSSMLKYLHEECEVYYCGKEPGCHYKTQDEINDMIVSLAKKGHTVGRIKGGDPYIFGRGGEEGTRLFDEGIEFEVIPGITSAISVLNYAGIPSTYRKIAQSLHIFTGRSAETLYIDWNAAARMKGTLVFLMGFENINSITQNLIENGLDKTMPCAVIMEGTTSRQRKVTGTLEDIEKKAKEAQLHSPCIIVVGEVVKFSETLNWYEKKPLFGMNVCLTRSKEQAGETRERLLDLGAQVTEVNTIKIVGTPWEMDGYIDKLAEYKYIVFTSVNGVNVFFDHLKEIEYDIRKISAAFAVIGPATSDAVRSRGVIPKIMSEKFVAESLFEEMKKHIKEGDRIFLPRSKSARPYLFEALKGAGCIVDEAYIYDSVKGNKLDEKAFDNVDTILFTSPSTVKNLISMAGEDRVKSKKCIAIGPITSEELERHNMDCEVCSEYTMDGIIKKLIEIRRR